MKKLIFYTLTTLLLATGAFAQPIGVKVIKDTTNGRLLVKAEDGTWLAVYGSGAPSFSTFLNESVPVGAIYFNTANGAAYGRTSSAWAASATPVTPGTTPVGSSTSCFVYADASSLLQCDSNAVFNNSGSGNGTLTYLKTPSGGSIASNFFKVLGTQNTTLTSSFAGFLVNITSAGSSAQITTAQATFFNAGWTGASVSAAQYASSGVAGTQVWSAGFGSRVGNMAYFGEAVGTTTGTNTGGLFVAGNGDISVGVSAYSLTAKNSGTNIGVAGFAGNSGSTPIVVGGYFGLDISIPTFISSALIADTGAAAAGVPILSLRDAGTLVGQTIDGGATWSKVGTKTLVDATPTAFVRVAVPSNGRQGGIVEYCVDANDATNYQTRCGSVSFALVNEGGTEAGALGTPADADGTPTGTLTVAFTAASNAADTVDILANAASSLTETTLRINYTVRLFGNAATAVTAQ